MGSQLPLAPVFSSVTASQTGDVPLSSWQPRHKLVRVRLKVMSAPDGDAQQEYVRVRIKVNPHVPADLDGSPHTVASQRSLHGGGGSSNTSDGKKARLMAARRRRSSALGGEFTVLRFSPLDQVC